MRPIGNDPVSASPANVSHATAAPRRPLSLRRNFSWTLAGNLVYALCQWATIVVIARLGSPELVGRFSLGYAIATPVFMFAGLQLRTLQVTDARGESSFADYMGVQLATNVFALLIVGVIAAFGGYSSATIAVILAVALAKSFESMASVVHGLLQKHEEMNRVAWSMIARGVLSVIAFAIAQWATDSVLAGTLAMAASWALVLFVYDLRVARSFLTLEASVDGTAPQLLRWNTREVLRLIWISLPLGLVVGMNSLTPNVPRYLLESNWGERELGLFSALAVLMRIGAYLETALGQAALPRLSRHALRNERRQFRTLVLKLMGFGLAIGGAAVLISALFGPAILQLLYGAEYASHADALTLLMLAAGIGYLGGFAKAATDAFRRFAIQLPLFTLVMIVTVVSGFLLIPQHGMYGAAVCMVVSKLTILVGYGAVGAYIWLQGRKAEPGDVHG